MPTIVYIPFVVDTNKYIARFQENLAALGTVVKFAGFKAIIRETPLRQLPKYDVLVMNWAENDILNPDTKRISASATLKIFAKAILFRLVAKRIVFVRHNNYAHATAPESRRLAHRVMDAYEFLFDVVLTHSSAEDLTRRIYCPHPLYVVDTSEKVNLEELALPQQYFVIFGQIAPYKKLRELMLEFPASNNLVIIGSVLDREYGSDLEKIIRSNIYYRPGFLSETVAQTIMGGATAAIVAHSDADMVVSGSFFYAISFRTPVIAVETPFFKWAACHFGDDIVSIVPSLGDIAARVETFTEGRLDQNLFQRIEEHFGDVAIQRTLRNALQIKPSDR